MSVYVIAPGQTVTIDGNNLKLGPATVPGSWHVFPAGNSQDTKAVIHPGPETVIVISDQAPTIEHHGSKADK